MKNTVPCMLSLLSTCPRDDRRAEHLSSCPMSSPHTSENEHPVCLSEHAGSEARPWYLAKMCGRAESPVLEAGETERSRETKTHTCACWRHDCVWRWGLQGGDEVGMRSRGLGPYEEGRRHQSSTRQERPQLEPALRPPGPGTRREDICVVQAPMVFGHGSPS